MKSSNYSFTTHFYFCITSILLTVFHGKVIAQNFTNINWGTAKSQPAGTHEIHGEVVNGKLYIFGGYDVNKRPNWTPTKRSYKYDPVTNLWTSIADLPHTPNGLGFGGVTHEGLTNDSTNIYFAGGYISNSDGTGQVFGTKQVWRYNIASNSYTRLPDLPEALAAGQMRYLSGKLHYIGGANYTRADVSVHYALDLNDLASGWKSLAPLLNPVNHPGSAVYNGKIYFVGGAHHQDNNTITQKTLEAYDPNTNTWTRLADMPVARDHISSAVVVLGTRIIVLGGETSHSVKTDLVSAYTPSTNTWQSLTPLTTGKSAGVAAVLDGNIYYTGGNFSTINRKGVPIQNTTTTLLPLADAFVRSGTYSTINYGKDTTLVVKGTTSNYTRVSYLKFSLSGINNVYSAKLRIYGSNRDNTASISISSYGVDNDSWTESGINFSNAPTSLASPLSSASVSAQAEYYDLDVTSYVRAQLACDKVVSLLVKNPSSQNTNVVFKSRENVNNRPQLIISSTTPRSIEDNFEIKHDTEIALSLGSNFGKPALYPNPARGSFNIKFPQTYQGDFFVRLLNVGGRVYNLGKLTVQSGGTISMNISGLALSTGVYILQLKSDKLSDEIKLVIE